MKPVLAVPADYDAILDHVGRTAPDLLALVTSHLDLIRTAHHLDEHVQRAQGLHPGRPFVEHAREACAIVESGPAADDAVVARLRRIVDFHARSVAGRSSYAGDAPAWADEIADHEHRTGGRIVYWDGIAHTVAAPVTLGLAPGRGPEPTVGGLLRERYTRRYVSVGIGFHHGDLGFAHVPEPAPDLVDARLGEGGSPARWLDLRDDRSRRSWEGPAKVRVISGIYDVSRDAMEHMEVASLPDAFDVVVQLRRVSPVRPLDQP